MAGTPDHWTAWFDRHAASMLLLARQRVASRADAEDVVQDAFVRFWPRHRQVADAKAYLYRCVKRCAADFRRAEGRRQVREQTAAKGTEATSGPLFLRDPETAERQARIEVALWQLPIEQREVIVLRIWADLTFAQISEVLGAPVNTVASRYRYALSTLRGELTEEVVHE
jgi:RNA polymerase sigma-70 factor (ECF subfamily)